MTFALYLLLLALTMLHPIEGFAPELQVYRPVLVLSVIVLLLAVSEALRTGVSAARARHLFLIGSFVIAIELSLIMRGWFGGALDALIEFSAPAILWLLTVLLVTTMRRLKVTCALLAICMTVLSIAAISAYHYGFMVQELVVRESTDVENHISTPGIEGDVAPPDMIPAEDTSDQNRWRVHSWGFLSDPNDFSQAIVMVLPMLIGGWIRRKPLRNLLRIWIPGALLLYAAYLTHSRGATLGLGALLLFGMMRKVGRVKAAVMVGIFAFALVVVGFTGGRSYSSSDESAGGRIAAWSEGLSMLRGHPITGVGYGNFTENFAYTAHNSFVLCFAELGLLGYFFWIAMLVLAFKEIGEAIAVSAPGSDERRWATLLRLSLIGFLTCAAFLSRTYQPTLYILLALCIASWHCAMTAATPEARANQVPIHWIGTTQKVMLVSMVIIYLIVRYQNAFVR